MIIMPIIVIFFQENGLSLKEVMILQGVYSLMVALMEIPSGYLADVFGRKHTLTLGAILAFIGFLILSLSFTFWPFFIGEIILGIGASFISGADSALLYDSLLESDKESDYTKVEGRAYGIGNFSEALAGICGGLLADISLRYPLYFQVFIAALIIPLTFSLIEPKSHKENLLPKSFKAIWEVVKFSLLENKLLKWLIILSSIIGFATLSMAWFAQPYFKSIDLPIKYFGFAWAILNLSTGFSSMNAYRFESLFSKKSLSLFISIGISLPILLLSGSTPAIGLLMIFIIYLVRGIATPILRNLINEITESNVRATVLSIRSFCIRITFSIFAPLMGWVADIYSLRESFIMLGVLVIVVSLISYFKLVKLSND
jgi:MFS family permease